MPLYQLLFCLPRHGVATSLESKFTRGETAVEDEKTQVRATITLYPIGKPVRATITLYPIGRPVRATITLYPIGRPVRATITLYPIGRPARVGKGSSLQDGDQRKAPIQSHN